jgi:hypothetical protein
MLHFFPPAGPQGSLLLPQLSTGSRYFFLSLVRAGGRLPILDHLPIPRSTPADTFSFWEL